VLARAVARARLRIGFDAPVEILGAASGCAVAFCGPFVIRRPIHPYHRLRFAHEIALLEVLAELDLPVPIPTLVWHSIDPPVMIYRRIDGVAGSSPFRDPALPPGDTLLFACGHFLGHLHRLQPGCRNLCWLPPIEADTLAYLAQVLAGAELPADIRRFGAAALADWAALSGRALRPCVVHNDVNWKNLILNPSQTRLAGVIDWSISGIADPHFDLGYLASWGPERFAPVAAGYAAARGQALDPHAADAAVRLRLLATLLHAAPDAQPVAFMAARAHMPLA
jgi:aminoglycoside phosphotransferase (APT) family kinase protein